MHYSIHGRAKTDALRRPEGQKPPWRQRQGRFRGRLVRWARRNLRPIAHFLRAVDRNLIPFEVRLTGFDFPRLYTLGKRVRFRLVVGPQKGGPEKAGTLMKPGEPPPTSSRTDRKSTQVTVCRNTPRWARHLRRSARSRPTPHCRAGGTARPISWAAPGDPRKEPPPECDRPGPVEQDGRNQRRKVVLVRPQGVVQAVRPL